MELAPCPGRNKKHPIRNSITMAQITTLKDKDGQTLYPITSSQAVRDSNGNDLDTLLNGKVGKEQGKSLSSNDYTAADKQKLDSLPTNAQLTAHLNGKQSSIQDSEDVLVAGSQLSLTEKAKYDSLVKQFIAAGGGFNDEAQLGALNGIEDLTYDDMAVILDAGRLTGPNGESFYGQNSKLRTNLPPISCWDVTHLSHTSWGCTSLEVFNARKCCLGYAAFAGCKKLHTIINVLNNEGGNINTCFNNCEALKSLKLRLNNKATSFSLSNSPLIDLTSIQYMINNAANTAAITITVHPDVYAKLTGDETKDVYNNLTEEEKEQWTSLVELAANKNIQFATT